MLNTNIPDKDTIPLTFSMLESKLKIKNAVNPYILTNYVLPELQISYADKIKCLFDKVYFNKILTPMFDRGELVTDDDSLNINTIRILNLLFPTAYPATNYVETSYNKYIMGLRDNASMSSTIRSIINPQYSYINIDKWYTVVRVLWLNDIINHPIYSDFIKTVNEFEEWINVQKENKDDTYNAKIWIKLKYNDDVNLFTIYADVSPHKDSITSAEDKVISHIFEKNNYGTDPIIQYFIRTYVTHMYRQTSHSKSNPASKQNESKHQALADVTIDLFNAMKPFFNRIDNKDDFIFNGTTLQSAYDAFKKILTLPPNISSPIEIILRASDGYRNSDTLKEDYFEKINMKIDDLSPAGKLLTSKFPKYAEYIKKLKTYNQRKSTNKPFTRMITQFINNEIDNTPFIKLCADLKNAKTIAALNAIAALNTIPQFTFKTGPDDVVVDDKKICEIYVQIDLIDGKLTQANKKLITCNYQNENLLRIFNHINDDDAIRVPNERLELLPISEPEKILKQGGFNSRRKYLHKTYKRKQYINKTKRNTKHKTKRKYYISI